MTYIRALRTMEIERRHSMFQRNNIVPDLTEIFWAAIYGGPCLSSQQLTQGGLSSFDLGAVATSSRKPPLA
jgi:hypothetical protein